MKYKNWYPIFKKEDIEVVISRIKEILDLTFDHQQKKDLKHERKPHIEINFEINEFE